MKIIKIINGKIVTPEGIKNKKALLIKDEKILDICSTKNLDCNKFEIIDANGGYIIPGLIDTHSDALERKFYPRPNVDIPLHIALSYHEKKLLSCGITTQFHGIYWGEELEKHRSLEAGKEMVKRILAYRERAVLNHKIFIRYSINEFKGKASLLKLIQQGKVDLISFQNHTPGQGQFKDIEVFKKYYSQVRGWTESQLEEYIKNENRVDRNRWQKLQILEEISQAAAKFKIPLVSHDDDEPEKVRLMKGLGVKISEFPLNLEAANCAKENNIYVVVGAPNVVQGKSSCANISARDLIKQKASDIICSDYHLPSMLCASLILYQEKNLSLPEAINMITLNPAKATGLKEKGAILPGKAADIVVFKLRDKVPEVTRVFIKGRSIYHYAG